MCLNHPMYSFTQSASFLSGLPENSIFWKIWHRTITDPYLKNCSVSCYWLTCKRLDPFHIFSFLSFFFSSTFQEIGTERFAKPPDARTPKVRYNCIIIYFNSVWSKFEHIEPTFLILPTQLINIYELKRL